MAFNRNVQVKEDKYSGQAAIHARMDGLAADMRATMQQAAALRIGTENMTVITDSSGGTSGSTIKLITIPPIYVGTGGTASVLGTGATSLDDCVDSFMTAYATLIARCNLVFAELGLGSVDDGPGTSGGTTLAAVDEAVANNTDNDDAITYLSGVTLFKHLLDTQATVIALVDHCRVAVGQAKAIQAAGAGTSQGTIAAGFDIGTGASPNGAVATGSAAATMQTTVCNTQLELLNDNVAYLCALINAVTEIDGTQPLTRCAG